MRILALDWGEKTIGCAVGETEGRTAQPLYTITRRSRSRDLEELRALATRYRVDLIVVGLPLNMDGSTGPAAEQAQEFARRLEEELDVPTALQDERLSTVEAEERLQALGLRPEERAVRRDAVAAAVILEDYLALHG
ncbi:MAG TPA: Holliday junction resolvase RuvX [Armatimonadetes bacterium]|nr:Holliday junction resolvase RuvX [Armatimonadota bacterium]